MDDGVFDRERRVGVVDRVVTDIDDEAALDGLLRVGAIDVDAVAIVAQRLSRAATDRGPPRVLDQYVVAA